MANKLEARENLIEQPVDETKKIINFRKAALTQLTTLNPDTRILDVSLKNIDKAEGSEGYFIVDKEKGLSIVDALNMHKDDKSEFKRRIVAVVSDHLGDIMKSEHATLALQNKEEQKRNSQQKNFWTAVTADKPGSAQRSR